MTEKDLMVGDFVTTEERTIIRITEIMHQFVGYENRYGLIASYEELKPLPITDKILNQIADYYKKENFWFLKGAWFILEPNSRADGVEYLAYSDDEAMWRNDYFARCRYIHELQHILRVTGHGDLADNLKAE